MKRLLLIVTLLLASTSLFAGPCVVVPKGVRMAEFKALTTITTTASSLTLPTGGYIVMIQITAPSTNTDTFYVALVGTATSAFIPIVPGAQECVPFQGGKTLSFISATGTQTANTINYYQ